MATTAFLTDKYEITMLQASLESGLAQKQAVFELFARKLPEGRRYGVVAGTGRVIEAVENFRFTEEQIAYLEADPVINENTIDYLRNFKFSGRITGYHEGDLYFPNSPILTVEGTFGECVLLETVLLSIMNYDSAVASAASRMVQAAHGMPIIEMGSRRAHDQAAVAAARAAYIVGFTATSNLEAGMTYGIPTTGTSAHAFSLAHHDEKEAFRQQVKALGVGTTLLVDTFDIAQGIRNAVEVAGTELGGIRIDSGDLYEETENARKLLDELGAKHTKIILSSDIDEYVINELVDRDTPVDGIGAGTKVVTGSGHPTAGMVYKLVAIEEDNGTMRPVAKKASGKKSVGGRKWAWRRTDSAGYASHEIIFVRENREFLKQYVSTPTERTLQHVFIEDGETVFAPTLEAVRRHHKVSMAELRMGDKTITNGTPAISANI
ncbi:MAG: nicotinate phosphoribosyltransferase [Enterococcus sp.]|nr:nicotinate phosphoribosyltransferase [Enterococcus sp.]